VKGLYPKHLVFTISDRLLKKASYPALAVQIRLLYQRHYEKRTVQVTAPTPNFPYEQPFSFYTREADGTMLTDWATEFVRIGSRQSKFGWKDIVEDYVPVAVP
jgi:hypothetical protein